MKAVVAAFNQEKALVGAFSVITNLRMELGCNFLRHYLQVLAAGHRAGARHEGRLDHRLPRPLPPAPRHARAGLSCGGYLRHTAASFFLLNITSLVGVLLFYAVEK